MPLGAPSGVRWLGAYLTDGRRLVQVIGITAEELLCEDVRFPADRPADVLHITFAQLVRACGGWRLVRESDP